LEGVEKWEKKSWYYHSSSCSTYDETSHIAFFESPFGGDGIHPTLLPCPYYQLKLGINEEEYDEFKKLPGHSVMKVSFELKK